MPGWLRKPLRKPECPGGLVDTPHPLPWPSSSGQAPPPEAQPFPRSKAQTTWTGRQAIPGPWLCGYFPPSCPSWTELGGNALTTKPSLCSQGLYVLAVVEVTAHAQAKPGEGPSSVNLCQAHLLQPRRSTDAGRARGVLRAFLEPTCYPGEPPVQGGADWQQSPRARGAGTPEARSGALDSQVRTAPAHPLSLQPPPSCQADRGTEKGLGELGRASGSAELQQNEHLF